MQFLLAAPCLLSGLRGIGLQWLQMIKLFNYILKKGRFPKGNDYKNMKLPWKWSEFKSRLIPIFLTCTPLVMVNLLKKYPAVQNALKEIGLKLKDGKLIKSNAQDLFEAPPIDVNSALADSGEGLPPNWTDIIEQIRPALDTTEDYFNTGFNPPPVQPEKGGFFAGLSETERLMLVGLGVYFVTQIKG